MERIKREECKRRERRGEEREEREREERREGKRKELRRKKKSFNPRRNKSSLNFCKKKQQKERREERREKREERREKREERREKKRKPKKTGSKASLNEQGKRKLSIQEGTSSLNFASCCAIYFRYLQFSSSSSVSFKEERNCSLFSCGTTC